jgi:hypothetical protein
MAIGSNVDRIREPRSSVTPEFYAFGDKERLEMYIIIVRPSQTTVSTCPCIVLIENEHSCIRVCIL